MYMYRQMDVYIMYAHEYAYTNRCIYNACNMYRHIDEYIMHVIYNV